MNMSVKLGIVAWTIVGAAVVGCSGSDGAPGATGATGPAGSSGGGGTENPSVSAITPGTSYLARTTDVTVSGYGTAWSASTTMDFGADVKVNKITVASPTALIANITIAKTAAVGARDVTVTDGTSKEVYKGAFNVAPPAVISSQQKIAQGSIVRLHAAGKDLTTPFDVTHTGDGLLSPIVYTNLAVADVPGVTIGVDTVATYSADMTAFIDVTAATSTQSLDLSSGPAGAATNDEFPAPNALPIVANTPIMLTAGTAATGNTMNPGDTALYQFTPGAALAIIDIGATSTDNAVTPGVILLPKSGKFSDLIGYAPTTTLVTQSADPYYAIYWDNTGATGAFSVSATSTTPAANIAEVEPNNAKATAQTATALPFLMTGASLTADTDQDWIKYTAVAGDVGKKFHVQTVAGDSKTDTVVDVFASDGTTSLGGPSDDSNYHEDFVSTAIPAAGVYYIQVTASSSFNSAHKNYQVVIRLQ